jgi:hypothetical protein
VNCIWLYQGLVRPQVAMPMGRHHPVKGGGCCHLDMLVATEQETLLRCFRHVGVLEGRGLCVVHGKSLSSSEKRRGCLWW